MTDFLEDPDFLSELKTPPPDNVVMFFGWRGCMEWASRKSEIVAYYTYDQDIGSFNPSDRSDMLKFCDWATENVWGDPDAITEE